MRDTKGGEESPTKRKGNLKMAEQRNRQRVRRARRPDNSNTAPPDPQQHDDSPEGQAVRRREFLVLKRERERERMERAVLRRDRARPTLSAQRRLGHAICGGRTGPGFLDYELAEELASEGWTGEEIAEGLGMSRETLMVRQRDDSHFLQCITRGRAQMRRTVGGALLRQTREGNTVAGIFLAKTRLGFREHDGTAASFSPSEIAQALREELAKVREA